MLGPPGAVMVSPTPEALNPYVHLLARSLQRVGARCEVRNRFSLRWLMQNREQAEVLHFHWAEHLCSSSSHSRIAKDFLQLIGGILYARATARRIVYTVHNLDPYGRDTPAAGLGAHWLLLRLADALHVHDEYAFSRLRQKVGGDRVVFLAPHGHYIGAYPNDCSRAGARTRLGLDEASFVYLFLGQMRPHKGIESLVEGFRRVSRADDKLVLAGWAPQAEYGKSVQRLTEGDPRIMVFPRFVANDQIQSFLNACDVCVLPYRTVTTSGAAILALSFGKPVIAPRIGGFPCLLRDGAGILYDPEADGLPQALLNAQYVNLQAAGAAALAFARRLDWDLIAREHLSVYEKLLQRSPGASRGTAP